MNITIYRPSPQARRRGLTVLETSMALLILCFAVGGLAQMLTMAASHRRATESRRLAVQELANQAEQIAILPWDQLTAERLAQRKAADSLLAAAPSASLAAALADDAGPPAAKRIHLEITWKTPAGDPVEPVGLTLWRHQPTEAQP